MSRNASKAHSRLGNKSHLGLPLKLSNKRQIQAVIDGNNETNARFKLITHHDGQQSIMGMINSSVLSKADRTHIMQSPQACYYQHYERPVNSKLYRAATKEMLHGVEQRQQQIAPDVRCIDIKDKYQEADMYLK